MNKGDFNVSILFPNLLVLLLVALGISNERSPLVSQRPLESGSTRSESPARLWQDPLAVRPPGKILAHSLEESFEEARTAKQQALRERDGGDHSTEQPRVLLLPVLLNSNPNADEGETRLRVRYAVLSALARAQYVPLHPEKLRFVSVWNYDRTLQVACEEFDVRYLATDGTAMPGHEHYSPPLPGIPLPKPLQPLQIPVPYDRVIVLWLDENALSAPAGATAEAAARYTAALAAGVAPHPRETLHRPYLLHRLDRLLSALLPAGDETRCQIKIVGPTNSDQLVDLARPAENDDLRLKTPVFLSPRATASTGVVQIAATRQPDFDTFRPYSQHKWPILRTITTDDALVAAMLGELARRGAAPGPTQDIVLVGEWDTLYSRGFGRTFAAQLNARDLKDPDLLRYRATWASNPVYFHEFSYLRGLDGEIAGSSGMRTPVTDAKKAGDGEEDAKPETKKTASGPANRAFGESQFDYLRRLEDRLGSLDAELQRGAPGRGGPSRIAAIGVVGSDVYDKLLVLRALRKRFPQALFFTPDLDASYLDREEREWTRNLLIVSPYGLRAGDVLQGRTPPFRDSYQTALYLTCLQAVGVQKVGAADFSVTSVVPVDGGYGAVRAPQPRLFEIGRSEIFDLSGDASRTELQSPSDQRFFGNWASGSTLALAGILLTATLLWFWCVRGAFVPATGHAMPLRPRASSAAYALAFIFAFVWFLATIGIVTGLNLLPPQAAPLTQAGRTVLSLCIVSLYLWTFYQLSSLFRQEVDPKKLIQTTDARTALLVFGLFIIGGAGLAIAAIVKVAVGADEEPFALFEGVSIWPTDIVRGLTILFGISFVLRTQLQLVALKTDLAGRFRLPLPFGPDCVPRPFSWQRFRWVRVPVEFWLKDQPAIAPQNAAGKISLLKRNYHGMEASLWRRYCRLTTHPVRFPRVILAMVLYLGVFFTLGKILGQPIVPARGMWSRALDVGVLTAAVLMYTYLLFFVLDATILAAEFVKRLTAYFGTPSRLREFEAIHLVSDLVGVVGKLIYLPFSVLFMLIASRNSLFDRWDWPPALIAVFISGLALIVVATTKLQRAAQTAQRRALSDVDDKLIRVKTALTRHRTSVVGRISRPPNAPPPPEDEIEERLQKATPDGLKRWSDQLEEQKRQIKEFDDMAFQSWHQNPIYRALLIPIGGLGSLQLLQKALGDLGV